MKFEIKNRFTGAVQVTAEIERTENERYSVKLGRAVRWALEADANLARANLARADLAGANLAGAYLAGSNLTGSKWRDGIVITKRPIQVYGLHWDVTILDAHMQIGCELHSLADWSSYDDARIAAMDGRDALRFWRAHKESLLSLARGADRSFEPVTQDAKQPA